METPQETIKKLPHAPGVYTYRDSHGAIIYIGKAKDLKKRVSQYFQRDDAVGPKTQRLVSQIASIETVVTVSELDALLLEAKLIHDHTPKYNVVLKDDKSPLYILLTLSEPLPHVLTVRRSDLPKKIRKRDVLFGPFQSAGVVRSLLRRIRHTIPYCTQRRRTGKPCFYSHLGLCDPCPSRIWAMPEGVEKKRCIRVYRVNIFRIHHILSGKSSAVLKELEGEMKSEAKANHFENAATIRDHIQNLYDMLSKTYDPMLYVSSDAAVEDIYANELSALRAALLTYIPNLGQLTRIECIDISNTGGSYATGSLVVLTGGRKDTASYKRFRIRRGDAPNDVGMVREVVTRRMSHSEWPLPDLLVVDGGKGQVAAAGESLAALKQSVPRIGLAKRFEEIIIPLPDNRWKVLRLDLTSPAIHVLSRIRDEAHRFAITYHRFLRKKSFLKSAAASV